MKEWGIAGVNEGRERKNGDGKEGGNELEGWRYERNEGKTVTRREGRREGLKEEMNKVQGNNEGRRESGRKIASLYLELAYKRTLQICICVGGVGVIIV